MTDQCKNCQVRGDLPKCLLTVCGFRGSWIFQEMNSIIQKFEKGGIISAMNDLGDDGEWTKKHPTEPGWYPVASEPFLDIIHLQCVCIDAETGKLAPFNIDANDDWKRREWECWRWWYSKPVKLPPPPKGTK